MLRRSHIVASVLAMLALAAPAAASDSYGPGSTLLVGRSSGLGALPAQSDGASQSGARAISANARFTVFTSNANDLGVADARNHAFVRDDQTGAVTLLDRAGAGGATGNDGAYAVSISSDGSKACFYSGADNLVPGVGKFHVYVVTIATGAIVAADRATGGALANSTSGSCSLNADGSEVAFQSDATNLGVAHGRHVYVRFLGTNTTQLVDSYQGTAGDGYADEPVIDGSGNTVAFQSTATNLAGPGGDANGKNDVYARFLGAAQPVLVSRATGANGTIGDDYSNRPSISADGQLVAFDTNAADLADGDGDHTQDVHVRNLLAGTTTLVSRADGPGGAKSNGTSYAAEIAADGSAVAFLSRATNMGADPGHNDEGANHLAYLRTLSGNHTTIVSRAGGADGALVEGFPDQVSLDQHATNAVFTDGSAGLDPLAPGTFYEVYQRHLAGDFETRLISRPADASGRTAGMGPVESTGRAVSADGRFVVFSTPAPLDGPAGFIQVYVRDALLGTTRLVSRAGGADGAPGNAESAYAVISADGTKVAFSSAATNLTADDGVAGGQVFVRDLVSNTTTLVSTGPSGPADAGAIDPALSQDGTRVAFRSWSANLVPGDANKVGDIFVRDLVAGTTVDASLTTAGGQPDDDSGAPALSADGTRVGFVTSASNMGAGAAAGKGHAYVRDLAAGTTALVDRKADGSPSDGYATGLSMSADGNRFAFSSDAKLTPDVTDASDDVYVRDVAAGTTMLASIAPDGSDANAQAFLPNISLDGTKVAFFTPASNFPENANGGLWQRDLAAATTTRLSAHDGSDAPSDDGGQRASLDADGNCAVFASADSTLASPSYAGHDIDQLWMRAVGRECPVHAPDTKLTSGPNGSAKVRTAYSVFGYAADESNATFACSLDAAPAKPCGDTFHTGALRDGVHRFSVAATDRAGNTDPTPALVTFTVGVPPRITKLRLSHGRLSFKLSEKATVRVRLARAGRAHTAAVAKLTLKRKLKAGTRRIKLPLRRLRKGHYHLTVTATDAGGNRSVPKRKSFDVRAK